MHKLLSIAASIALFITPTPSKANENDEIVNMMVNMVKQSGQLATISQCLDMTEHAFIQGYKKTIAACIPVDGLEGDCIISTVSKNLGISQERFSQCSGKPEVEIVEEDQFDHLSEEEFIAQMEQKKQEGIAQLKEMAALAKQSSQNTEKQINLPIYQSSSIASHQVRGFKVSKGKTTLPMATFTTSDSPEKVAEFYKSALPSFKVERSENVYFVMEDVPDNLFELSLDMENYPLYFVEHVEIYSLNIGGEKMTHIVIVYEPS